MGQQDNHTELMILLNFTELM